MALGRRTPPEPADKRPTKRAAEQPAAHAIEPPVDPPVDHPAAGPVPRHGDDLDGALPLGMRIAGAWGWRILVLAAVVGLVIFLVAQLRYLVIPVFISVLLAALLIPLVHFLRRHGWPKWAAVAVAEVGTLVALTGLIYLVVTQVIRGFANLRDQTVESYDQFKDFLANSPFDISEQELQSYIDSAVTQLQEDNGILLSGALSVGSTLGHVVTGLLLVLFSTLFLLIDGRGIWNWIVRLFPRNARQAVDGAGHAGWVTLGNFVRVQILVAFIDAVGIGLGAFFLGIPLAIPIAVLVFLGSFVPVVGAVFTGALAVFIALVYNGPFIALWMLVIVLLVQQIEGHVLQPLIMGTAVKVHPLAVVLAVAAGGFLAGIPGTFFAVPVVATANVMIKYIAQGRWRTNLRPTVEDVVPSA
ncbi:MAG TPA: AI-2E family transporter [Naasia sp.]|jgi:predicted PurR-regulated permease PerM